MDGLIGGRKASATLLLVDRVRHMQRPDRVLKPFTGSILFGKVHIDYNASDRYNRVRNLAKKVTSLGMLLE